MLGALNVPCDAFTTLPRVDLRIASGVCVDKILRASLTSNIALPHNCPIAGYRRAMPKHTNDRLQGTLDLLVLKTLASRGPMHGYGITLHIEQVSEEILRLEEGSLYPALHRMT